MCVDVCVCVCVDVCVCLFVPGREIPANLGVHRFSLWVWCDQGGGAHSHIDIVYGVATISRLLKIIGLFCRISPLLQGSFAKETYNFKEPTSRSHCSLHIVYGVATILIGLFYKLLQKKSMFVGSLLIVAISYTNTPMGWLRLVGSWKWQVSFAEYRLFDRALFQKRPNILRSLLVVSTT